VALQAAGAIFLVAGFAGFILISLTLGKVPTRNGWVSRAEQPGVFWFSVGGAGVFLLIFITQMLSAPSHR
jgi:hypothetical protein